MRWFGLFLALWSTPSTVFAKDACDFSQMEPVAISTLAVDPVAVSAKDVLEKNCVSCHGLGATGGAGIFNNILDREELLRKGFVNLADPPKSRIYDSIKTGRMPKGGAQLPLAEVEKVLKWVQAGAPDWEESDPVIPAGFVAYPHEVACIRQDAEAIDRVKRGDAGHYQWFTLSNVYNSGNAGKFQNLIWALDNSLNYTAFGPVRIVNSTPVDSKGVIRRIDLRDLNRAVSDFDVLLLNRYLYAIDFSKGNYFDRFVLDDIEEHEDEITKLTGRERPYIRADFVVEKIMGPDLYYQFLRVDQFTLPQIEKNILAVDANRALENFEADASVIRKSGVSLFNRVIHRYDANYVLGGTQTRTSYWKTFDVTNEIALRNFFAFPLGPKGVNFGFYTAKIFEFDAGEAFVQMPNGLQAFFVADAAGKLLTEAVTTIVVDKENVDPFLGTAPSVVTIGTGCLHCHSGGMNYFADQLAFHAQNTSGFTNQEINAINQLFPEQKTWDAKFTAYNASFKTAHEQVIKSPVSRVANSEPTWVATRTYLGEHSVEDVAGEFNLSANEFKRCLYHAADLAQQLGLSEAGFGRVTREALDDNFDEVVAECGLGKQVRFKNGSPPVKPPPVKPPPVKPPPVKPGVCQFSLKNERVSAYLIRFKSDYNKIVYIEPGETFVGDGNQEIFVIQNNKWVPFFVECREYKIR